MKLIIELIAEMIGYLIVLLAEVWAFVHFTGYGNYYNKMQSDNDETDRIINQENNKDKKDDSDDIIHYPSI